MKLLSPAEVAALTGLPYAKALTLIKGAAYVRIDRRYYISESNLQAFLTQGEAIEITTTEN